MKANDKLVKFIQDAGFDFDTAWKAAKVAYGHADSSSINGDAFNIVKGNDGRDYLTIDGAEDTVIDIETATEDFIEFGSDKWNALFN